MNMSLKKLYLESVESGQLSTALEELLENVDTFAPLPVEYCESDVKMMEVVRRIQHEKNMKAVEELGKEIGYGNLMSWASALWRYSLKYEDETDPLGAFVPRCTDKLSIDEVVYDEWVYALKKKSFVTTCTLEAKKSTQVCFCIKTSKELGDILFILAENGYSWAGMSGPSAARQLNACPIYLLIDKPTKVAMCLLKRPHVLTIYNAKDFDSESLALAISNMYDSREE